MGAVPPFAGVAVNVTEVPSHIEMPGLAPMLTLAGTLGFTVMVMVLDVAGEPVAQVRLLVMLHVMLSPLASVDDV